MSFVFFGVVELVEFQMVRLALNNFHVTPLSKVLIIFLDFRIASRASGFFCLMPDSAGDALSLRFLSELP